jgi:hypothetical protein
LQNLLCYGVLGLLGLGDRCNVMAQNSNTTTNAVTVVNSTTTTITTTGDTDDDDDPVCYTTFRDLSAAIAAKPEFVQETFIVCAGTTVITVGVETFLLSNVFINGDVALSMRQFTRVNCGTDGSSRNNCTVRGGASHIYVNSQLYRSEDKKRMSISGFTFEESDKWAIYMDLADSELLVIDCIFRHVQGVLYGGAKRFLEKMEVTFRNCTFMDNALSGKNGLFDVDDGGVHLSITDSVIANNTFSTRSDNNMVRFSICLFVWYIHIYHTPADMALSLSLSIARVGEETSVCAFYLCSSLRHFFFISQCDY